LTRFSADVQLVWIHKEAQMMTDTPVECEKERSDSAKCEGKRITSSLPDRIDELASEVGDARVIGLQQVHELADASGPFRTERERSSALRGVEVTALEMDVVPARYFRNLGTIGVQGQIKLLRATVAIVGLGGLGGYVTEALARMGVGHLILIDGDVFEHSNLNRQLLCAEGNLGVEKARAACQRVAAVNAAVETVCRAKALTRHSLPRLLGGVGQSQCGTKPSEVVVDALDRLPTRLVLQEGAQALGIPMVHGSIAGFLGQVTTIFPDDLGLRALYGDGVQLPEQGLEAELGTPAATPMAVAAWQAQEVVKVLTGRGDPLRHRLLVIDMESATSQILHLG
jgi:molybdopterin/thiamine biosynthesis adenylyltransferase